MPGTTDGRRAKVLEGTMVWLSSDSPGDAVGLILKPVRMSFFRVLQCCKFLLLQGAKDGKEEETHQVYHTMLEWGTLQG